jgi:hypothetical protein
VYGSPAKAEASEPRVAHRTSAAFELNARYGNVTVQKEVDHLFEDDSDNEHVVDASIVASAERCTEIPATTEATCFSSSTSSIPKVPVTTAGAVTRNKQAPMLDDVTLDRKRVKYWHPGDTSEGGANGSHARRADASGTAANDDKVIAAGGFIAVACRAADDVAIDKNRIAKRRRMSEYTEAAVNTETGASELSLHASMLASRTCELEVAQDAPT